MGEPTCDQRICEMYADTMLQIKNLIKPRIHQIGTADDIMMQYEALDGISLGFDYVSGNTIGIEEPCFRWQLSWGGPQDEFLFPINRHIYTLDGGGSLRFDFTAESVTQYWLRDWGDSSHINLDEENNKIMNSVLRTYGAVGKCFTEFRKGEGIPVHEEPF